MNSTPQPPWVPNIGDLAVDTSSARALVGEVIGWDGTELILRPLSRNGKPWHTSSYRPAELREKLRAKLAEVNRRHLLQQDTH
ncbi:hypothetical protein CTZ27_15940 [Streptomyces griseocarneus]|nr:hypothetical protein CTZ27_15940 [Streptomyces griseocarneus]